MTERTKHIFSRVSAGALRRVASRIFWAAILLVHLRAMVGVVGAAGGGDALGLVARMLGLGVTAGFCGLKLFDASFLRLLPGWRPAVASWVAVALLHVGVLERSQAFDLNDSATQVCVALGAVGLASGTSGTRRVVRFLRELARSHHAHSASRLQPGPIGFALQARLGPPGRFGAISALVPRGPPLL